MARAAHLFDNSGRNAVPYVEHLVGRSVGPADLVVDSVTPARDPLTETDKDVGDRVKNKCTWGDHGNVNWMRRNGPRVGLLLSAIGNQLSEIQFSFVTVCP